MKIPAPNERFGAMSALAPQTILCKLARYSPAASSVEAATTQSRRNVIGNGRDTAARLKLTKKLYLLSIKNEKIFMFLCVIQNLILSLQKIQII
jgi:hypothetical protein